jgi:hypothetical protein
LNTGAYIYTYLDDAAVAIFDVAGKEISSHLIPKSQVMRNLEVSSFYLADRVNLPQKLLKGDQYKSFIYLNGKDKGYVILNDLEENTAAIKKGHIKTARTLNDCNAFYYPLDNILPGRNFLFGKPTLDDRNDLALFTVSDYDKTNNLFVTLKVERKGKEKSARLVWMTP